MNSGELGGKVTGSITMVFWAIIVWDNETKADFPSIFPVHNESSQKPHPISWLRDIKSEYHSNPVMNP